MFRREARGQKRRGVARHVAPVAEAGMPANISSHAKTFMIFCVYLPRSMKLACD